MNPLIMSYTNLQKISEQASEYFTLLNESRDKVLKTQRDVIRCASLSIRAIHRGEPENAMKILEEASGHFTAISEILEKHKELYYAGYLLDAQKEFCEAHITYALIMNEPLPHPEELHVEYSSYFNGMGEAIGELRRFILDRIRCSDFDGGEDILDRMEELYCVLTSLDFPDAITRGLRRTTDIARSIIEKTRGDLTQNLTQKRLAAKIERILEKMP